MPQLPLYFLPLPLKPPLNFHSIRNAGKVIQKGVTGLHYEVQTLVRSKQIEPSKVRTHDDRAPEMQVICTVSFKVGPECVRLRESVRETYMSCQM